MLDRGSKCAQRRFRPDMEEFERRTLPAVSVTFMNGSLVIDGTGNADSIQIRTTLGNQIQVLENGMQVGPAPFLNQVSVITAVMHAGNDVVDATQLTGYSGECQLNGGEDADTILGSPGVDKINGGNGTDTLEGRAGNDDIGGNNGNDTISGEGGTDILSGGDNADWIYGGDDSDTVTGGNGTDNLFGEGGNDDLQGEIGNDTIFGGVGADQIKGGADNDRLYDNVLGIHDADVDNLLGDGGGDGFYLGAGDTSDFAGAPDYLIF